MCYVLRDKITINRPIVFLCGPYYEQRNKSDRRNIMRKTFQAAYKDNVLPLIIDDFLTEKNIKDPKINIQLLEEIIAAISYKTYIFLDTLSAASELGLFMNHSLSNKVIAYIPKQSDIINKRNIGYFAKDVILKSNGSQAGYIEYRPSIQRSAIATDYVVEHYGFIEDTIPENIKENILEDDDYKNKISHDVLLMETEGYPDDDFNIHFQRQDGVLNIFVSISLLFYVVSSLMYEKYKSKLITNKKATISDFDADCIQTLTIDVFSNYFIKKGIVVEKDIRISTILQCSFDQIIYHLVTFCYVYHCFSTYKGLRLVDKHMDTILDEQEEVKGNNPLNIFGLTIEEYHILADCEENSLEYYVSFMVSKSGKTREFVKYMDDEHGEKIKTIHKKIAAELSRKYTSSDASSAYKKGDSIKRCVQKHKNSNSFIKYDISKFFNSIDKRILVKAVKDTYKIDPVYDVFTEKIISSFYFENKLPLGLVISPVLSDVYMLQFDEQISKYCEYSGLIYTRYADDILISHHDRIEEAQSNSIDKIINENLSKLSLKVNQRKKKRVFFDKEGHHIKYVGINIVHSKLGNKLSVGKKYIYDVVKEYYQYMDELNSMENSLDDNPEVKTKLFYDERRIAGKLSFIISIIGEEGWEIIRTRIGDKEGLLENGKLMLKNIL